MGWTAPTTRSTGELITQSIWNTDVVANLVDLDQRAYVPPGLVAYYVGTLAPSGWSEYTAARGRVIVGLPSGGTLAGTLKTALTNLQDKTHTHVYTTVIYHRHGISYTTSAPGPGSRLRGSSAGSSGTTYTEYEGSSNPSTQATSHMMPYIQLLAVKKD